jgi:hypothetical protein
MMASGSGQLAKDTTATTASAGEAPEHTTGNRQYSIGKYSWSRSAIMERTGRPVARIELRAIIPNSITTRMA